MASFKETAAVWPPFVRAALAIGLLGGFGLGAALFAAILLSLPLGPWWRAAADWHAARCDGRDR
jgi:hypothetical protein